MRTTHSSVVVPQMRNSGWGDSKHHSVTNYLSPLDQILVCTAHGELFLVQSAVAVGVAFREELLQLLLFVPPVVMLHRSMYMCAYMYTLDIYTYIYVCIPCVYKQRCVYMYVCICKHLPAT